MDKATLIYQGRMPYDEKDNLVIIEDFSHYITDKQLYEINKKTQAENLYFDYSHTGGDLSNEALNNLVIGFQLVQGLGTNLIYDLMKSSLLKILNIIPKTKKPDLYIEYLGEKISLDYQFELTDEQKDKLVDAGINFLLQKSLHKQIE